MDEEKKETKVTVMVEEGHGAMKPIMEEVYHKQMDGVIFHQTMVDFYDFLRLKGFMKWQMHQFKEELETSLDLQEDFIENHHMLLSPYQGGYKSNVIPDSWYTQHTNMDTVSEDIKAQVKRSLHIYLAWEEGVLAFYKEKVKGLIELEAYDEYIEVQKMCHNVAGEINYVENLVIELESVGYDPVYIRQMQDRFCYKYGEKK